MTAQRAIELLRVVALQIKTQDEYEIYQAVLLGIASLERHVDRDYRGYAEMINKLPGED